MSSKILIFTACFFIGLNYSSWSVLGDDIVPREEQQSDDIMILSPAHYEIMSDSERAMQQVHDSIMEQLDGYHDYVTGKMNSLEVACKKNKSAEGTEYHTTGPFQSRVMNKLVEIMTEKIEDIAQIFVDDMVLISQNVSEVVEESLEERVTLFAEAFGNMDDQVETLVTKEVVVQIKESISNLFVSSIAGLRERFQDKAGQLEMILMARKLTNHAKTLEGELKTDNTCKTSNALLEESLQKTSMTTLKVSEIKTKTLSTKSSCSEVPEQMLTTLDLTSKENKNSIQSLSDVLQDADSEVSSFLHDLALELKNKPKLDKESGNRPSVPLPRIPEPKRSHSVSSIRIPVPTTEQAILKDDPACLDSTFISAISPPDICGAAVRLDRCLKEYLSFHCCRSCRRAGYSFPVPDLGASRRVPVLEALTAVQHPSLDDRMAGIGTIDPATRKTLRKLGGLYARSPING